MFNLLDTLTAYLKCPSVSADPAYLSGMVQARSCLKNCFAALGLQVEEVDTPLHPLILAHHKGRPGAPRIFLYGHYDVQPPDPLELWETPPFQPTVRHGRLYARGAADNKGPLMAVVAAVARLLARNPEFPLNLSFLIEGEEEIGSPSFGGFLEKYQQELSQAAFLLVPDTCSPDSQHLALTVGLRGLCGLEVTVYGPSTDLHSGLYGGAVPNPITALLALGASLHDAQGRVNVPGFYDAVRPAEAWEREQVAQLPVSLEAEKARLGIPCFLTQPGLTPFEALRFAPTLEFNGISGGYQGRGSKTIIPAWASAKITCRLVPDQSAQPVLAAVQQALLDRCPPGVRLKFESFGGGDPYQVLPAHKRGLSGASLTPLDLAFQAFEGASESIFGCKPLFLREGGSVPIVADLKRITGLDSLLLGAFTPQDQIHAPNEGYDLAFMEKLSHLVEKALLQLAQSL